MNNLINLIHLDKKNKNMRGFALLILFTFLAGVTVAKNRDSVGIKQINNQWYVIHKVDAGMGLYTIAKRYGVKLEDIIKNNPDAATTVHPGQILMIPYNVSISTSADEVTQPIKTPEPKKVVVQPTTIQKKPIYHTVTLGETLYRISVNFKVSVDDLRKWNNLPDNSIEKDQQLIVGYTKGSSDDVKTQTAISQPVNETSVETEIKDVNLSQVEKKYQLEYEAFRKELEEKKKSGKVTEKEVIESVIATAIDDESMTQEKNLALHVSAPLGTIIKLTNPMNGNYVFVKVIGKLQRNIVEENVNLKITRTAANKLGIKDKYFRLDTHYTMEIIKK